MWATAEICERVVRIDRDWLACGQLLDQLQLVGLILEHFHRLLAADLLADEPVFSLDDLFYPRFDLLQVVRRERSWQVKVIVEATLDRWPDGEFTLWKRLQNGLGHHVRHRVSDPFEFMVMCLLRHEFLPSFRFTVSSWVLSTQPFCLLLAGD